MSKNIAFFPCKIEHSELLKFCCDRIFQTDNIYIGSPLNWGKPQMLREDIHYFNDLFEDSLSEVDELYILDVTELANIMTYLTQYFDSLVCNVQNIEVKILSTESENINELLHYPFVECIHLEEFKYDKNRPKLYKLNSIIIGVGKLLSLLSSDKLIFGLLEKYEKAGLNVKVITRNYNYSFMNQFILYPEEFMRVPEEQSILLLNEYIELIEKETNPDVIIVDFPHLMMKYSDDIVEDYGISTFVISQSMVFDYFFVIGTLDVNNAELIADLSNVFAARMGIDIDLFILENIFLDLHDVRETQRIGLRNNDNQDYLIPSHKSVIVIRDDTDIEKAVNSSLETLKSYANNL